MEALWPLAAIGWEDAGVIAAVGAVVVALLIVAAVGSMIQNPYGEIGRGGLSLDVTDRGPSPAPDSPAARAEAREEIRQLMEARSARRESRGLAALDVEAEVEAAQRSLEPRRGDPALRAEVRGLVEARNERRRRQGKPPLEIEAEIDRQIAELDG